MSWKPHNRKSLANGVVNQNACVYQSGAESKINFNFLHTYAGGEIKLEKTNQPTNQRANSGTNQPIQQKIGNMIFAWKVGQFRTKLDYIFKYTVKWGKTARRYSARGQKRIEWNSGRQGFFFHMHCIWMHTNVHVHCATFTNGLFCMKAHWARKSEIENYSQPIIVHALRIPSRLLSTLPWTREFLKKRNRSSFLIY